MEKSWSGACLKKEIIHYFQKEKTQSLTFYPKEFHSAQQNKKVFKKISVPRHSSYRGFVSNLDQNIADFTHGSSDFQFCNSETTRQFIIKKKS